MSHFNQSYCRSIKKNSLLFSKKIILSLLCLLPFLHTPSLQAATDPTDSLKIVLSQTNTEEERIDVLYKLLLTYAGIDIEQAIPYAKEAVELAEQIESDTLLGTNLLALGALYVNVGFPDSALLTWNKALNLFKKTDDQLGIADTYYKLSYVEIERRANFRLGLDYCFKALKIYDELGYEVDKVKVFGDISICYQKLGDNNKAYEWANKMVDRAKALDNEKLYISGASNLGTLATDIGQYEEAIQYYDECIKYYKKVNNLPSLSAKIQGKANAHRLLGNKAEAMKLYKEGLAIATQSNFNPNKSLFNYKIGVIHLEEKDYRAAIQSFEKAKNIALEYEVINDIQRIYLGLTQANEALGNYKQALAFHQEHTALKDSIFNKEQVRKMTQLELGYEFDKKQLADSLAYAQQKTVLESSINQEKQARWFTFGIAALLAALLLGAFWTLRRNRKTNQVLATQNELIEKRNAQNELLLKEIHHRVKNNLQTISSLLSLQSDDIEDANALEAVKESQNRVRSMALIHQKLYQGEQLASVKMKNYFETMTEALVDSFGEHAHNVSINVPMDEIELDVDTAIPVGLIVNELVTNSLKYAFPDKQTGQLSISLVPKDKNTLSLKVADNGVGASNPSTQNHQGTGFGTRLVKLLTMQLNGKIEQITHQGTTIVINFSKTLKAA